MRSIRFKCQAAALLAALCACGAEEPWDGSFSSLEQLGDAAAKALSSGDAEALRRLRVNREEFLGWIWEAFPASQPPQNFPGDFAWDNLNKDSARGERNWAEQYGGREWTFAAVRFDEPTEKYDGFRLLRGTALILKDESGKRYELRILGSVIEKRGRYKLLSCEH